MSATDQVALLVVETATSDVLDARLELTQTLVDHVLPLDYVAQVAVLQRLAYIAGTFGAALPQNERRAILDALRNGAINHV